LSYPEEMKVVGREASGVCSAMGAAAGFARSLLFFVVKLIQGWYFVNTSLKGATKRHCHVSLKM
jgi:hypothetical protein